MLEPRLKLTTIDDGSGKPKNTTAYFVWDSDTKEYIQTKYFGVYATKQECQNDIDFYNSLVVRQAS